MGENGQLGDRDLFSPTAAAGCMTKRFALSTDLGSVGCRPTTMTTVSPGEGVDLNKRR